MNCRHQRSGDCPECEETSELRGAIMILANAHTELTVALTVLTRQVGELTVDMGKLHEGMHEFRETVHEEMREFRETMREQMREFGENINKFLRGDRPNGKK